MTRVFIDGRAGTTGLQIEGRLGLRDDIRLIALPEDQKKDPAARKDAINRADVVFLCLPDAAAREAVAMAENPHTRIIDASTAHRTAPGWAYGFPELSPAHRQAIAGARLVANPGCHATGFIALVYPLVQEGLIPPETALSAHSITGYTGGGKSMIQQYESPERDPEYDAPRHYALTLNHKHIPEMMAVCGLKTRPIFCPIVCDFPQGMLVTIPLFLEPLGLRLEDLREVYAAHYQGQKNIRVCPSPESGFLGSNNIVGTNTLEIFVSGNDTQAMLSARFDNLGKGASGAAVQNLNVMLGLDEGYGL